MNYFYAGFAALSALGAGVEVVAGDSVGADVSLFVSEADSDFEAAAGDFAFSCSARKSVR